MSIWIQINWKMVYTIWLRFDFEKISLCAEQSYWCENSGMQRELTMIFTRMNPLYVHTFPSQILYFNYPFPINLAQNWILLGAKWLGKVYLQFTFGLDYQESEKNSPRIIFKHSHRELSLILRNYSNIPMFTALEDIFQNLWMLEDL